MIEICNLRNNKPEFKYDVYIDRRSVLGNPFKMKKEIDRDLVCDHYENYFNFELRRKNNKIKNELLRLCEMYKKYGKLRLFCWCFPKKCHGETIKYYILNICNYNNII